MGIEFADRETDLGALGGQLALGKPDVRPSAQQFRGNAHGDLRGHNVKELMRSLLALGTELGGLSLDTAIAAYLIDPAEARYALPDLIESVKTSLGERVADRRVVDDELGRQAATDPFDRRPQHLRLRPDEVMDGRRADAGSFGDARPRRTGDAELEDHLDLQEERGIVEPALTMQVAINQLAPIAGTDGINNPYYRALADKTDGHPDITDAQRDALLNEAFSTFDNSIKRAYQSLLGKLQTLITSAPLQIGVGQYLDGAAYYEYALKHHTTTDLTPAEIHQLGLDELVRIRAEMLDILVNELGYDPNLTLSQHFALVRQDGGVIPAANVKSTYEAIIEQAKQDVSEAFDIFPTSEVVVIGVPFGGLFVIG